MHHSWWLICQRISRRDNHLRRVIGHMAASSTSAVSRELPVAAAELISRTKKTTTTCRYGYLPSGFHSLEDLLDSSYESLFRSIQYNPQHVLHQLLPPPTISVPVDTVSPSLLHLQSLCAKTSLTACCSMMIYIDYCCFTDRTVLCLHWCSYCVCIVCLHFSLST